MMDDFPRIPNTLNLFCWPPFVSNTKTSVLTTIVQAAEVTCKNILLHVRQTKFVLSLSLRAVIVEVIIRHGLYLERYNECCTARRKVTDKNNENQRTNFIRYLFVNGQMTKRIDLL